MPTLSPAQKTTLRTHPHSSKLYLAVHVPTTIYTARVNDATIVKGERDVTFDGGAGTLANIKNGMSLWVSDETDGAYNQQDKGRVRIKSTTDDGGGTGVLHIAENEHIDWEDNDYLTVKEVFEYWPMYPRITNGGGLTFYKDYDIVYTDQNENLDPIPIMGPPACGIIDNGTVSIYFDAQDSYCLGSAISTYAWVFPSGTPATSAIATPGYVSWTATGIYMVSLTVTAANGKTLTAYRPVFIFDTSSNRPYDNFAVRSARGSLSEGGWEWELEVFGDADAAEFSDGAMVVLFAEAKYGTTTKNFGMNYIGRHNIRGVGWITEESIRKNPDSGSVTFRAAGLQRLMRSRENFMCALDYTSGSPTTWVELKDMDTDRAIYHYLRWQTTIFTMTDVLLSGELHASLPGPFLIKHQDFARGSVWDGIKRLCAEAFLITPACDRGSRFYVDYNPQLLEEADRASIGTVMLLEHQDWIRELEIRRRVEKSVNFVDFEGIAFDGTTVTPVISYAPGRAPEYMGSPRPSKRHVLNPTDWQNWANMKAGLMLGWWNNEFGEVRFPCNGDYSVIDVAPREYMTLTLVAGDTKRGIVWTTQALLLLSIEENYNNEQGTCQTNLAFEKDALGVAGVTGDYPPDDPPEPDPDDPPIPPPPVPDGTWRKKHYIATRDLGVFYTENFVTVVTSPLGVPTWAAVSTGLDLNEECRGFRGDPFDHVNRQYDLMTDGIYRRVTGGNWVSILTYAEALALAGGDDFLSGGFGLNGLDTSINQDGHIGVLFNTSDSVLGWRAVYLVSDDYGATWAVHDVSGWRVDGATAHSLTIGALQGSSPYAAGQVMYAIGQWSVSTYLWYSTDGGATWSRTLIGTSVYEAHCLVDPNDQSRVFVGCLDGAGPWNVGVSLDHGASVAQYDTNASENTGYPNENADYYHLSVGMDALKTVRVGAQPLRAHIHTTRDNGGSWGEIIPEDSSSLLGLSLIQDAVDLLYLLRQSSGSITLPHVIWASDDEGLNMAPKSGANANIADTGGGDSIPYNCGGVRGILQIWE